MKIKISPLFYPAVIICCIFGNPFNFFITYISLTLHEMVHLFFLHKEKCEISEINIEPFGICIKTKAMGDLKPIVYLSAPLFNIFISLIFYFLKLKFNNSLFLIASASNFALGIFNLIPFLPFDGGRALMCKFQNKKIVVILSLIGGIMIITAGISMFFKYGLNFPLIMTGIFITANSISENEQIFERSVLMSKERLNRRLTEKMTTEIISAPYNYNAHKLLSSFNSKHFHIINIIKDGVVLGTVTETLIIEGLLNGKQILQDFI